jgi:hypothetical protein
MKKIVIVIAISIFQCVSCAVMRSAYYLTEKNTTKDSNQSHLLFGIDSQNWKTPWKIDNVAQYEAKDILVSVALENHYYRYWATGIWVIPLVPMFGVKSFFGAMQGQETSKKIKLAIYSKSHSAITVNPCNMESVPGLKVDSFNYYHLETALINEPCKEITINDWSDIAIFHVNLTESVGVESLAIRITGIKIGETTLNLPKLEFIKLSGFEWTSWL